MSRLLIRTAVVGLALALAGLVACGPSSVRKTLCATNLRMLWSYQEGNAKKEGGRRVMPSATGSRFWIALQSAAEAAGSPIEADALVCPLSGKAGGKGVTTYRGPKADVNTLPLEAVVGCCSGIHSDASMCILLKDGSVHVVDKGDPLQKRAAEETLP